MKWIALTSVALLLVGATLPAAEPPVKIRAARSVHLGYPAPDSQAFYIEQKVEQTVPGSYFMAAGFNHGYFGIQEQSQGRKVVIFSVWDPTKGDVANAVPLEQRVEVLAQGEDVEVKRFGGEGTGGQSFFKFDWKPNETYRFLVKATVTDKKTAYAGYFYLPAEKKWKHLVTFRTTTGGQPLRGLYSFVEDFRRDGASAEQMRRASFGNPWIQDLQGKWLPLTTAKFTASSAAWEAKESIDAGQVNGWFFLQTGGATKQSLDLNAKLHLPALDAAPVPPEVP